MGASSKYNFLSDYEIHVGGEFSAEPFMQRMQTRMSNQGYNTSGSEFEAAGQKLISDFEKIDIASDVMIRSSEVPVRATGNGNNYATPAPTRKEDPVKGLKLELIHKLY